MGGVNWNKNKLDDCACIRGERMRKATKPKKGFYAFRSKINPDECPFEVYIADGAAIEDYYDEITEAEYNTIIEEQKAKLESETE